MPKCAACRFKDEDVIHTANGSYYLALCRLEVIRVKVVDPDVERECDRFEPFISFSHSAAEE